MSDPKTSTDFEWCPNNCWYVLLEGETTPHYLTPIVPWEEAVESWDSWIICPVCAGTGRVFPKRYRPWRDRSDSAIRGYVAGSMIAGWATTVFSIFWLTATWDPEWILPVGLFAAIGALSTYMWRHG